MQLPSVLLHDHLDGGLRVSTIIELAEEIGYTDLPTTDPVELAAWFDQSSSGSLESYLEAFQHTIAVMQTESALERIAYEAAVDLASDGVVYAELRFRPGHSIDSGLSRDEVLEAIAAGLRRGAAEGGLEWGLIIDALRQLDDSMLEAEVAIRSRASGVVGFDIAGPEEAFPPTLHLPALRLARESGLRVTIHAGEAGRARGVEYIASAMEICGAERIGHGIEIIDDCVVEGGDIVKLGPVARRVRDRQVPLELAPNSNLATKQMSPGDHPLGALFRAGFNVTLNTDNRLMSATSMSKELDFARAHHGFSITDLALTARRSLEAAFCDHETKIALWEDVIAPAYLDQGAEVSAGWVRA